MRARVAGLSQRLSLAHQFMLVSLAILLSGMVVIGWWVGRQIEIGVINRTAATTALYVDSFVAPHLQELGQEAGLRPEHLGTLGRLLEETSLGQHIVAFKVWDVEGRVLYSTNPSIIGSSFPVGGQLARAWQGEVTSQISRLREDENTLERVQWARLLETYSPVRRAGTNEVIAVAEFYQTVDEMESEVATAQRQSWLLVGTATLAMYLLLVGIVQRGSNTIVQQRAELSDKVARLTSLLAQNAELHERVRRAATRATELNERFLRRVSAELHDGPAQDLSAALLGLDRVMAHGAPASASTREPGQSNVVLEKVRASVDHALQEVRSISGGLRLPELDPLTPAETLARVVRAHEKRTGTKVVLEMADIPSDLPLPVKITLYRVVQEALTNAYRHGGGVEQRVTVACEAGNLQMKVSDRGPGFTWSAIADGDGHLGLVGMRERVETLGGTFAVQAALGQGTSVVARLPLKMEEDEIER